MVPPEQAGGHKAGWEAAWCSQTFPPQEAQGGRGEETATQERDQGLRWTVEVAERMVGVHVDVLWSASGAV